MSKKLIPALPMLALAARSPAEDNGTSGPPPGRQHSPLGGVLDTAIGAAPR